MNSGPALGHDAPVTRPDASPSASRPPSPVARDLEGKVALITGASRGIGEAIALRFAQAGAKVVLAARKPEALEAVAEAIRGEGGQALARSTHTGDSASVAQLVDAAVEAFGGVDIVVNNAATNPHFGPFMSADDAHWDKTFDVNVKGYYRVAKACIETMKARGGGSIVNVASVAGLQPQPGMGVYCCSKAAVVMMTQVMAAELAHLNIRVNALAPGFVRTKFSGVLWQTPALHEKIVKAIPAGRIADPHEIAGAAHFLAGPTGSFTSGAVLRVDGAQLSSAGIEV